MHRQDLLTYTDQDAKAIFQAIQNDSPDMVELLLKKGVPLEIKDDNGDTPLIAAAKLNRLACLKIILAYKQVAETIENTKELFTAIKSKDLSKVQALLRKPVDLTMTNDEDQTPVELAADDKFWPGVDAIVQLQIIKDEERKNLNKRDKDEWLDKEDKKKHQADMQRFGSALLSAVSVKQLTSTRLLLKLNSERIFGWCFTKTKWNALHIAVNKRDKLLVRTLLESKHRFIDMDTKKRTPVMLAADRGYWEIINIFIELAENSHLQYPIYINYVLKKAINSQQTEIGLKLLNLIADPAWEFRVDGELCKLILVSNDQQLISGMIKKIIGCHSRSPEALAKYLINTLKLILKSGQYELAKEVVPKVYAIVAEGAPQVLTLVNLPADAVPDNATRMLVLAYEIHPLTDLYKSPEALTFRKEILNELLNFSGPAAVKSQLLKTALNEDRLLYKYLIGFEQSFLDRSLFRADLSGKRFEEQIRAALRRLEKPEQQEEGDKLEATKTAIDKSAKQDSQKSMKKVKKVLKQNLYPDLAEGTREEEMPLLGMTGRSGQAETPQLSPSTPALTPLYITTNNLSSLFPPVPTSPQPKDVKEKNASVKLALLS